MWPIAGVPGEWTELDPADAIRGSQYSMWTSSLTGRAWHPRMRPSARSSGSRMSHSVIATRPEMTVATQEPQ